MNKEAGVTVVGENCSQEEEARLAWMLSQWPFYQNKTLKVFSQRTTLFSLFARDVKHQSASQLAARWSCYTDLI